MIVSLELMNAVIAYLGKRPYEEVYQLITAIQHAAANQPVQDKQPSDPETPAGN